MHIEQNTNEADEESTILCANLRLASAKSSMLHGNNPDAAYVYEIHRKDGEKEHCCILLSLEVKAHSSRITPAIKLLCEWLYSTSIDRADFGFIFHFESAGSCINILDMLALANYACLRCRRLIGAYLLCCFVQG